MDHSLFISHKLSDLLVGQMQATLHFKDKTSMYTSGQAKYLVVRKCWPDFLADDYIHRSLQKELEDICFYDMTSQFKKIYKSYKPKSIQTYEFSEVIQDINSVIYPNWNIQLYQG